MVFDEELGLAYEGYNAELLRAFLILVHYTDLELDEFDNADGRHDVYDAIASHSLWDKIMDIVDTDMADVDGICMRLEGSARKTFERRHSMEYRLGKTFASLLGTEDLMETVAKAEGLNTKLVDVLDAMRDKKQHSEVGGVRFAKKSKD